MVYANNISKGSAGTAVLQNCKTIRTRKGLQVLYVKGAVVCLAVIQLVFFFIELTWLLLCAICLTLPLILAVEIIYEFKPKTIQ